MSEFFLEIGCEEIPARMLPGAIVHLREALAHALAAASLSHGLLQSFGTPRRLAAVVSDVATSQADREEQRRGPPVERGFEADGRPGKALEGFARSCGVAVAALERIQTPKGAYFAHTIKTPGRPAAQVLPELILDLLRQFPWPKSMRWGEGEMRFVRPLTSLVALLDGQVLPLDNGEGLMSGHHVAGHRFMAPGPWAVSSFADYRAILARNRVMLDLEERKSAIRAGVTRLTLENGGEPHLDEELVEENACLVEWPVPLQGRFDPKYLDIPPEVLVTSMKSHQKYFAVRDADGRLKPCFVVIANMETPHPDVLVAGFQRVLRARLEDAAFYWDEDRKGRLERWRGGLDAVVYQAKLGSVGAKSARVANLAEILAQHMRPELAPQARRAGELCKCDLISGMVYQFPELQGIMGAYYAAQDGEDGPVVSALREQYLPQGAGDPLPASPCGRILAMADKLDTLVGCFGVGLEPSGNKDPFALRRAALGIIRMLLDAPDLRLGLSDLVGRACDLYPAGVLERHRGDIISALLAFFNGRLQAHFKSEGLDYDLLDAVFALSLDDLGDVARRVAALSRFRSGHSAYAALVAANRRIANILEKNAAAASDPAAAIRHELLADPAERTLCQLLEQERPRLVEAVRAGDYDAALNRLSGWRETIDRFFDEVMVMADDPALRQNRIALIRRVKGGFDLVADISRLVVQE
ncbi:MAG: glycine--tRNA ligase subunit beta [Magnetococcus sp. WYHC-3]